MPRQWLLKLILSNCFLPFVKIIWALLSILNVEKYLVSCILIKWGRKPQESVLVNGQWYSPSEVEALGGKKSAKKWKRSLLHMDKPIADYDLSCCDDTSQLDTALSSWNVAGTPLTSVDNVTVCGLQVQSRQPTVEHVCQLAPGNPGTTTLPLLVNTVLSFIKAFRLKGDKDSLRMIVTEHFSSNEVEEAVWQYYF